MNSSNLVLLAALVWIALSAFPVAPLGEAPRGDAKARRCRPSRKGVICAAAWIVLSPIVLYIIAYSILEASPRVTKIASHETWDGPTSEAYAAVTVSLYKTTVTGWRSQSPKTTSLTWRLVFENEHPLFIMGDEMGRAILIAYGEKETAHDDDVGAELIAAVLKTSFPGADGEALVQEAVDVFNLLAYKMNPVLERHPPTSFAGLAGYSRFHRPEFIPRVIAMTIIAAVLIWFAGGFLILRGCR